MAMLLLQHLDRIIMLLMGSFSYLISVAFDSDEKGTWKKGDDSVLYLS